MLEDAFSIYLKYERNYSPLTVDRYADDLRLFHSFFKSQHPEMEWQTVTSEAVRQWMMSMMEKGGKATSVNRRLSSLRTFFKFLLRKEYITEDPTLKIVGPKKEKYLPSFVKESDMNRLLDSTEFGSGFKASRDRLILLMFYLTGMRRAELCGLKVGDFDSGRQVLRVTGKGDKTREIPVPDRICKELLLYLKRLKEETGADADGWFFVTDKGKQLYPAFVNNVVSRALAGEEGFSGKKSPHVLRHSLATHLLNNGADINSIKEVLGHASLAATQVYTHNSFEQLKQTYLTAHPRAKKRR